MEVQLTYCRRKSIGIYVSAEHGVEVRVPYFVSRQEAMNFVNAKRQWIEKQLAEFERRPKRYQPEYRWGNQFHFLGEKQVVHYCPSYDADFIIRGASGDDGEEAVEQKLRKWYRKQARQVFSERHEFWRDRLSHLNLPPSTVEPRMMKRRWGSCRSSGRILINTHLIKYPLECVDVVIVHELCHLREFNHSPRFYQLMTSAMPEWRRWDSLLNKLSLQY